MKKVWIIRICLLLGIGALLYLFPLFRVESLSERVNRQQLASFNPAQIVANVWHTDLSAAAKQAPLLETFARAFREDPQQAIAAYGNTVGVSSKWNFMVRVRGHVREHDGSLLRLEPLASPHLRIEIRNGPVFGNSVRDGSALFDVASFTDTRKFNDLSAELNKQVEMSVLPALFAELSEGSLVEVVGCFTLDTRNPELDQIRLVPIQFERLKQ